MPFIRVRLKGISDARAAAVARKSPGSRLLKIQSSTSKAVWENQIVLSGKHFVIDSYTFYFGQAKVNVFKYVHPVLVTIKFGEVSSELFGLNC